MADDQPVEPIDPDLAPDQPEAGTPPAEQIDPPAFWDSCGGRWSWQDCGHWHRERDDGQLEECEDGNGVFKPGLVERMGYGPARAHPPEVYESARARYEQAVAEVLREHPEWRSSI